VSAPYPTTRGRRAMVSDVYALAQAAQVNTPLFGYPAYVITIPLGFLLFGYTAVRILWRQTPIVRYDSDAAMPISTPAERASNR